MTLEECRDMITECPICKALVIHPEEHAGWHEHLRKAVDESEFLD